MEPVGRIRELEASQWCDTCIVSLQECCQSNSMIYWPQVNWMLLMMTGLCKEWWWWWWCLDRSPRSGGEAADPQASWHRFDWCGAHDEPGHHDDHDDPNHDHDDDHDDQIWAPDQVASSQAQASWHGFNWSDSHDDHDDHNDDQDDHDDHDDHNDDQDDHDD